MGAPDIFAGAYHPSQTAHLALSPFGLGIHPRKGGVPGPLQQPPRGLSHRSHLRSASADISQGQAAVKLHRVFSPHWGVPVCTPGCGFTGMREGTAGTSLSHSCTPIFIRQGIWLPFPRRPPYRERRPTVKRVRVTPGFHRPFSRLNPGFRYRHWPGLIPRTNPFGLAGNYVFVKQSGTPCHCDLRIPPKGETQAPLLPKLRGQFAEFPLPR